MSETFIARSRAALHDGKLQQALAKAQPGFVAKRALASAECDDFSALRRRATQARERALKNLAGYLEQFERKVLESGGIVHWAETPEQLREIVLTICRGRDARFITKGKSMVSEEVSLNAALQEAGYVVDETDLGEYIIQLAGETPSHIVAPALHKTRGDIEALFRAHHDLGNRALNDVEAIVNEARQVIRNRFLRADVGITGANLLVAETGQVVLVTNEGNGDLTATLPSCHIVTTSIEKIVADLDDASAVLRVLSRSATGQSITTYTSLYSGPGAADGHGDPKEFHVVILDNGRSRLLGGPYQEMLRCIKCAACMNHCPVYQNVGGHAYDAVYPGPMGSILTPLLRGGSQDYQLPSATSVCGRCDEVCPVGIPLTDLMRKLRQEPKAASSSAAFWVRAFCRVAGRPAAYSFITGMGSWMVRWFSRGGASVRSLPLAHSWTQHKNLPLPASRSFQRQLRKQLREATSKQKAELQ